MEAMVAAGGWGIQMSGPFWQGLWHIGWAVLLGGLVGLERSRRGRQAGLRTYAIVALAAAALVSAITQETGALSLGDPASRVIQGLLTGLGFLGAGVIMREGLNIKGLTTAASIWLTSAIGILCGMGLVGLAVVTTMMALTILTTMKRLENWTSRDHYARVIVGLPNSDPVEEQKAREQLGKAGMRVVESAWSKDEKGRLRLTMSAVFTDAKAPAALAALLNQMGSQIDSFEISSTPEE